MKSDPYRCFGLRATARLLTVVFFLFSMSSGWADTVVKWENLKKLDELAEKCEALCDQKDVKGLRKVCPEVKKAATAVQKDPLPKGTKDPAKVKVLQGDLKSLMESLTDPDTQDPEELTAILAGVHPIVEQLMEASGMPHVHEEQKEPSKEEKPK